MSDKYNIQQKYMYFVILNLPFIRFLGNLQNYCLI